MMKTTTLKDSSAGWKSLRSGEVSMMAVKSFASPLIATEHPISLLKATCTKKKKSAVEDHKPWKATEATTK